MSDFKVVSRPGQAPQDDGGFKVVSRPQEAPTPNSDFKVVSRPAESSRQKMPGFGERLKTNYVADVNQGLTGMKEGVRQAMGERGIADEIKGDQLAPTPWSRIKGAGKVLMGGIEYAASPANALSRTIVGEPVEKGLEAVGVPEKYAKVVGNTADLGSQVFSGPAVAKAGAEVAEQVPKVISALRSSKATQAAKDIRDFFVPTATPKGAETAATIRRAAGEEGRQAAQFREALSAFQPAIDKLAPNDYSVVDYIQSRGKGAAAPAGPELKKLADAQKQIVQHYESKLKELPQTARMQFQEDYLNQLWKKPAENKPIPPGVASKQGSTDFTKAKKFPTYAEGRAAGLEPVTNDPIKLTNIYVNNAKKYISAARTFNEMREAGYIKYFGNPRKVPDGWKPIEGRWTDKPARDVIVDGKSTHVPAKQAYAPAEVARVYNNYISRGMEGKAAYDLAHDASRASVAMTLGISPYHAVAETMHSVSQSVGDAIRAVVMGEGKQAAKALGSAVTPTRGGQKALDVFLGRTNDLITPEDRKAVEYLTRANFGFERDQFYKSIRPELEKKFTTALKEVRGPKTAWNAVRTGLEKANAPLFDKYIPNLKRAAAMREMTNYMQRHPEASGAELESVARDIADTIDNRFGIAVQDNIFWNKTTKQISQLAMLAPEWTKGKIAMAAEGVPGLPKWIYDIAKSGEKQEMPLATAQLLGLAVTVALGNSLLTYVHTGTGPESVDDLMHFRTGGTANGAPERGTIPGEQKDFMGYANDPVREFFAKLNPLIGRTYEAVTDRDYRGDPVPNKAEHILGGYVPGQIEMSNLQTKQGSGLTLPERIAGMRPAADTKRVESIQEAVERRRMIAKQRHDNKAKAQQDPNSIGNKVRKMLGFE